MSPAITELKKRKLAGAASVRASPKLHFNVLVAPLKKRRSGIRETRLRYRCGQGALIVLISVGSLILLKVTDVMVGLRVHTDYERMGLDLSEHEEAGYTF